MPEWPDHCAADALRSLIYRTPTHLLDFRDVYQRQRATGGEVRDDFALRDGTPYTLLPPEATALTDAVDGVTDALSTDELNTSLDAGQRRLLVQRVRRRGHQGGQYPRANSAGEPFHRTVGSQPACGVRRPAADLPRTRRPSRGRRVPRHFTVTARIKAGSSCRRTTARP